MPHITDYGYMNALLFILQKLKVFPETNLYDIQDEIYNLTLLLNKSKHQ